MGTGEEREALQLSFTGPLCSPSLSDCLGEPQGLAIPQLHGVHGKFILLMSHRMWCSAQHQDTSAQLLCPVRMQMGVKPARKLLTRWQRPCCVCCLWAPDKSPNRGFPFCLSFLFPRPHSSAARHSPGCSTFLCCDIHCIKFMSACLSFKRNSNFFWPLGP